jgi:restriction system protein
VLAAVGGGVLFAFLLQTGLLWPLLLLIFLGAIVFLSMSTQRSAVLLDQQEEVQAEDLRLRRTELLAQIETLEDALMLTGQQFERVVAELLQELGYTEITATGGSGDLCVDIKAVGPDEKQVAVQCKRYGTKKKVGSKEMQTFIGMIYVQHRTDCGLYFTTSSYTKDAHNLAKLHMIELIDGERLMRIIHTGALD